MADESEQSWYGVRCVFRFPDEDSGPALYEERVTLWRAPSFDQAIELAEGQADEYAQTLECEFTGLSQAYRFDEEPEQGTEVFSLMRKSLLPSSDYLTRFFNDGTERQRT